MSGNVPQLLGAEVRRQWIELRRYPMETISSIVVLLLVFLALLLGARYLSGSPIQGTRLSSVVLGYVIWALSMSATGEMGFSLQNEAQNGTLEQLFLSPHATPWMMLVRAFMGITVFVLPLVVILSVLIAITGVHFTFSAADLMPMGMALVTAWGLGLLVAVAAVLFKRMGQVLNMLQFVLIFVIMAPIAQMTGFGHVLATVLPLTASVGLLDHLMVAHAGTGSAWLLFAEAGLNAVLYLGGGLWLFSRADAVARSRGILAHY